MESVILYHATKNNLHHTLRHLDFGHYRKREYLVMELMDKGMDKAMKENQRRGETVEERVSMALRVGIQALRGLYELHSIGVLHRDLKVENMGFDIYTKKQVLLLDFNISRFYIDSFGQLKLPRSELSSTKLMST